MLRLLRWSPLPICLFGGCGPGRIEIPTPPAALSAMVAEYDNPTGTVPTDRAMELMTSAQEKLDALNTSRLGDLLADALTALRNRLAAGEQSIDPAVGPGEDDPRVDGYVTAHRICRGWDRNVTTPDPANGTLDATAVLHSAQLQRALWGDGKTCKGRIDLPANLSIPVYLDASFGVYLLGALPETADKSKYTAHVDGTLGGQDRRWQTTIDFRYIAPQIEVLVPVSDGNVVASAGLEGVQVRGKNGTFGCSIETGTCQATTP
jgi:hypothetical protein